MTPVNRNVDDACEPKKNLEHRQRRRRHHCEQAGSTRGSGRRRGGRSGAHVDEEPVPARVCRQLGVERRAQQLSLPNRDGNRADLRLSNCLSLRHDVFGQDLDSRAVRQNGRRANEHRAKRLSLRHPAKSQASALLRAPTRGCDNRAPFHRRKRCGRRQLHLKAVDLAAEKVAADGDVQAADERLATLLLTCASLASALAACTAATPHNKHTNCAVCEEDEPSAGAPDGSPTCSVLAQRRDLRRPASLSSKARSCCAARRGGGRLAAWRTRPHRSATSAIVVLSPPGMIRPRTSASCSGLRTCAACGRARAAQRRRTAARAARRWRSHLHSLRAGLLQADAVLAEGALQR